jgi:hypothetical protein
MKTSRSVHIILLFILFSTSVIGMADGQSEQEPASDDEDMGALLLIMLMVGIGIISLGIPLALAVWVRFDADRNGVENPLLWAILVWIFGLPGILFFCLYVIVIRKQGTRGKPTKISKKEKQEEMDIIIKIKPGFCPHCRTYAGRTSGKCSNCDSDLS